MKCELEEIYDLAKSKDSRACSLDAVTGPVECAGVPNCRHLQQGIVCLKLVSVSHSAPALRRSQHRSMWKYEYKSVCHKVNNVMHHTLIITIAKVVVTQ